MKNLIKNGQKIYMVPKDIKGGLSSNIENIAGTTITLKVSEDDMAYYKLGDVVEMFTVINDGLLYFKPRIVGVDKETGNVKAEFNKEQYEQLQRREYTRVDMDKEFTLKYGEESVVCKCLDLSAGGMKLETSVELKETEDYPIEFSLESKVPIECFFKSIRITTKGRGKTKKYIASGRFIALKNIDKIAIVQFCFKKQTENTNK